MNEHERDKGLLSSLESRGLTRRDFMKFCATMASTLALSSSMIPTIAEALEKRKRPTVVWLEFQDCAGDTESMLRASRPTMAELVLDVISLDYHETIMAPAGKQAEKSLRDVVKDQKGEYIAIVEGAIPLKDGGVYCTIGGRTAVDIAREVCTDAAASLAVGSCASWGGIVVAHPNPTGGAGLREAVPGAKVINLPGCPMNVENVTATIVHYLTFGAWPVVDSHNRPYFAYGQTVHNNCERKTFFDSGQFVRQWGDEGHRLGWCLYEMGCKGPEAYFNCPTIRWNEAISWPVKGGHGCIACASDNNWDKMYPFYRRLPQVPGFGVESTADKVGLGLAAVTAAGIAAHYTAHKVVKVGKEERRKKEEK
jgi:hydrogenase small subunit